MIGVSTRDTDHDMSENLAIGWEIRRELFISLDSLPLGLYSPLGDFCLGMIVDKTVLIK